MIPGTFLFSEKWKDRIKSLPETGMGYTVVSITLHDGRVFHQAIIDSGHLSKIKDLASIPFTEADIAEIKPTHVKWNW
jgi:hypothetical protein